MPRTTPVVANERFWKQVYKTETCWLWTGSHTKSGGRYGQGGYGRFSGTLAHRIAYEWTNGSILAGMTLDHLCKVPACVNPAHLEPVTPAENTRRHFAAMTHCKQGHELTGDNVRLRQRPNRVERVCKACDRDRHRRRKETP